MERDDRKICITIWLSRTTHQRLDEMRKSSGTRSMEELLPTILDDYSRRRPRSGPPPERLTPRQRQVLELIAEGQKTKDIARHLKISVKTVEMHRTQLMETLDLHNIAALVRYAIRSGLIEA